MWRGGAYKIVTLPRRTDRLVLRRYTYDDVKDILEFVSQPSVARSTTGIEATEAGLVKYIDLQNSYQPFEQDKCFDLWDSCLRMAEWRVRRYSINVIEN